ncbi:MAG: hypothetical protein EA424_25935 [Planctomycetaceae bacterium]|nr:MAG: hypothetical protein EA424_25935 [Planctomycetaceae bacterium]
MNLVREFGFDGVKIRNHSWQVGLFDVEPESQFIAVANTILSNAIDGDSATFISDTVNLKLTFNCIEGRVAV